MVSKLLAVKSEEVLVPLRRALVFSLSFVMLAGCLRKTAHVSSPAPGTTARLPYVDLEPGWRLRVITPITRSGKYVVQASSQQQSGNAITLSTSSDFIGYETDYYSIAARGRHGVRIRFFSAADTKDGVTSPRPAPRLQLFELARDAAYVRLLYLRRESQTDHDMAVIAARKPEFLASLTERVQSDPRECHDSEHAYCSWIPAGIAVRPERSETVNGSESWFPAR